MRELFLQKKKETAAVAKIFLIDWISIGYELAPSFFQRHRKLGNNVLLPSCTEFHRKPLADEDEE